jgi:tight adherence protein C
VSPQALAAGATAFFLVLASGGLARTLPLGRSAGRSPRSRRLASAKSLVGRVGPALFSLGGLRRIAPPENLRGRLTAAGEPAGLGVRDWMAVKLVSAVAASLPAALFASGGPGRLGLLLALVAPFAGFVLPDFWLSRLGQARIENARRRLPDVLDLLRVTIGAGVPPMRALRDVSACFEGVLAAECRRVAASVALGEPPDAALVRLAERLPADEIKSFADALRRARRHGLPLGKTLAMLASRARHAHSHEIREHAARAGPKIQLVVALLLVPSMLLMVAAVLASELLSPGLGLSY